MTEPVHITAVCTADSRSLCASDGTRVRWHERDLDPAEGLVKWKPAVGTANPGFRRMDLTARMFLLTAEFSGLDTLTDDERERTAIVLASNTGCLSADLRFERSLHVEKGIEPAVFPYTLPSTPLGEVAIRHHLRGPSVCLSVASGAEDEGLEAALDLLADGEADAALVLLGDWLTDAEAQTVGLEGKTQLASLLLRRVAPDTRAPIDLPAARTETLAAVFQCLPPD